MGLGALAAVARPVAAMATAGVVDTAAAAPAADAVAGVR